MSTLFTRIFTIWFGLTIFLPLAGFSGNAGRDMVLCFISKGHIAIESTYLKDCAFPSTAAARAGYEWLKVSPKKDKDRLHVDIPLSFNSGIVPARHSLSQDGGSVYTAFPSPLPLFTEVPDNVLLPKSLPSGSFIHAFLRTTILQI
ncbi:hypothetical protein KJ693_03665 [bacterium]|nr:hypothetical protein [bacterium]MBU1614391.1 hypothetical protein [bacterium]